MYARFLALSSFGIGQQPGRHCSFVLFRKGPSDGKTPPFKQLRKPRWTKACENGFSDHFPSTMTVTEVD